MTRAILVCIALLSARAHGESLLVARGGADAGTWKFHDGAPLANDVWRGVNFDASDWHTGAAPLGYGDDGMATTLAFGGDPDAKHSTAYFRRTFEWQPEADAPPAVLATALRCDDGGVVWLNGKEIARWNMPDGDPTGASRARVAIAGAAETTFHQSLTSDPSVLLRKGANVVAVAIHQADPASSDLVFDCELILYAKGEEPPVDHFADGIAALRGGEVARGLDHFARVPVDDQRIDALLPLLVERILPQVTDNPAHVEAILAIVDKAYAANPDTLETARAFVRGWVLARRDLMFPLAQRPPPDAIPAEFAFLTKARPEFAGDDAPALTAAEVAADLDYLELMIDNCYSYADRRGVDWKSALDVVRAAFADEKSVTAADLAYRLVRFIGLFGDPHSALRVPARAYRPLGFAPFLAVNVGPGRRMLAIRPDRDDFLDAAHPYLTAIDGKPLSQWLAAADPFVPQASPQYRQRLLAESLDNIAGLRAELGLPAQATVDLTLADAAGDAEITTTLDLAPRPPDRADWPAPDPELPEGIGYLRIASMRADPDFLAALDARMAALRDTRGLVIDVRGNGGGSQDCLRTLLPYFMDADAPLRVVNVAAYRLPVKLPQPNPAGFLGLHNRGLHPAASPVWTPAERATITQFLADFEPQWKLPAGKFSDWHAMGVRAATNPRAFRYGGRAVILSDAGCFSATDNFLGAFKGVPGVTLMGSTSGGGSGRMQSYTLPNSGIPLTLCQMASFQRDGHTYDGHGVAPDIVVDPRPEDFLLGRGDSVLEAAVAKLRDE